MMREVRIIYYLHYRVVLQILDYVKFTFPLVRRMLLA